MSWAFCAMKKIFPAVLAKERSLTKQASSGLQKPLSVALALILCVGMCVPMSAMNVDEAWAETNSDELYWNNSSNVNYFYWRFDRTDLTSNDLDATGNDFTETNAYYDKVSVTYETTNGSGSSGVVPYTIYEDHTVGYTEQSTAALNCSTVLGATDSSGFSDGSTTVNVKTEVGYVITGYVIACETYSGRGTHIGEFCSTAASLDLEVALDTTGLYFSDIDIDITPATFGHDSNGGDVNNYILLLQIAQVNVNLFVDKVVDKESVAAGETVHYTVTATTTNDLTNVTFTDEFFETGTISSVKYGDTALAAADSTSGFTYTGSPSKYYLDTSSGVIYLDGKWTSAYAITIDYDYVTSSSQANSTITNTVIATGTKTGTPETVQDLGVAQVKVIVNTPTEGSLRVYKTFSGLTTDEVTGETGVLAGGYTVAVTDSSGASVAAFNVGNATFYSSQTNTQPYTFTYFWDVTNLEPGTYTVTETSYTVDGYTCVSTYTATVGEETETAGTGDTANAAVEAGETTFVRMTNSYVNAQPAVKIVKKWLDAEGNELTLASDSAVPSEVTFDIKANDELIEAVVLTSADLDAEENAWVRYYVLDAAYQDSVLTVSEHAIDGYELYGGIAQTTGVYTVVETVDDKDEDGTVTGTHEETKTYDCTVFTAKNKPSVVNITVKKVVEGNLGDISKQFIFEFKIDGGEVSSFTLSDEQTKVFEGVSVGSTVYVREIADAADSANPYDVTYAIGSNKLEATTVDGVVWYMTTVSSDDIANGITIVVTNTKNVEIDTGLSLSSIPYALALGAVLLSAVFLIRRVLVRNEED